MIEIGLVPRTFLSLLALLAACTPKQAPENASAPPAVVMHGVRLRSYDGSTLSMTGEAEQATWERTGDLTATRATVRVPDKGTSPGQKAGSTTVYAKLMEGSPGTRQMVASGDVEVRTSSGMVALRIPPPPSTCIGMPPTLAATSGLAFQSASVTTSPKPSRMDF